MSYKTPRYLYHYNYALEEFSEKCTEMTFAQTDAQLFLNEKCVKFWSTKYSENFLFMSKDFKGIQTADQITKRSKNTGKNPRKINVNFESYGVLFEEDVPAHAFFWSHDKVVHLKLLTTNLHGICRACSWVEGPHIDTELVELVSAPRIPVYDPSTGAWV